MLNEFINLVRRIAGAALGAAAVSAQVGNTLVCIAVLIFGPTAVLGLIAR
jgi:hypothetical protein